MHHTVCTSLADLLRISNLHYPFMKDAMHILFVRYLTEMILTSDSCAKLTSRGNMKPKLKAPPGVAQEQQQIPYC